MRTLTFPPMPQSRIVARPVPLLPWHDHATTLVLCNLVAAELPAITFRPGGKALITLSFLLTTPGVWEPGYGFGFLSAMPGQFLAKDLVLLGVSIWTAAEAWQAAGRPGSDGPSVPSRR